MKVRAAVHSGRNSGLVVRELDLEEPRPDEVLIKTVACGVCHTDIWVQQQYANPVILGHEASGIVERAGRDAGNFTPGDHVITAYNWCGECAACRKGRTWEPVTHNGYAGFRSSIKKARILAVAARLSYPTAALAPLASMSSVQHKALRLMQPEPFLKLQRAYGGGFFEVPVERGGGHVDPFRQFFNMHGCGKILFQPGYRLCHPVCLETGGMERAQSVAATYINVLRRMSVDCDCAGARAAAPTAPDLGMLASTDILAVDKASVDMVYSLPEVQKADLVERIESRSGLRQLEYMKQLGMGNTSYEIVAV